VGFEDFFENKRNYHKSYRKRSNHSDYNDYRQSFDSRRSYQGRDKHFDWMKVLAKVRENRKLKVLIMIAAIVMLAIAILLLIALLPLLGRIFTFITQMDLKGLQEYITGLLDKVLKG